MLRAQTFLVEKNFMLRIIKSIKPTLVTYLGTSDFWCKVTFTFERLGPACLSIMKILIGTENLSMAQI